MALIGWICADYFGVSGEFARITTNDIEDLLTLLTLIYCCHCNPHNSSKIRVIRVLRYGALIAE